MIITFILLIFNIICLIFNPSAYQVSTINAIATGILLSNILWLWQNK